MLPGPPLTSSRNERTAAPQENAAAASSHTDRAEAAEKLSPQVYLSRWNNSAEALGRMRRQMLCGSVAVLSPDAQNAYTMALMDLAGVVGNHAVLGFSTVPVAVAALGYALMLGILACGLFVTFGDPGVYPRLRPGEPDPLQEAAGSGLARCKMCGMLRPPRTSHCYTCGVCVLEHDHHCAFLGGCVGARTLRWFTLFLILVVCEAALGVGLQCQVLMLHFVDDNSTPAGAAALSGSRAVASVVCLFCSAAILVWSGKNAVLYTCLTLAGVTRRESRAGGCRWMCVGPLACLRNVRHAWTPPPSLLVSRDPSDSSGFATADDLFI